LRLALAHRERLLWQQQTFSYASTGSGTHGLIVVVPQG